MSGNLAQSVVHALASWRPTDAMKSSRVCACQQTGSCCAAKTHSVPNLFFMRIKLQLHICITLTFLTIFDSSPLRLQAGHCRICQDEL